MVFGRIEKHGEGTQRCGIMVSRYGFTKGIIYGDKHTSRVNTVHSDLLFLLEQLDSKSWKLSNIKK